MHQDYGYPASSHFFPVHNLLPGAGWIQQYRLHPGIFELLKKDNTALQKITYTGKTGISSEAIQLDLYPG